MDEAFSFRVEGLKELEAKLKKLPEDIKNKELRNTARAGASVIRDEAKRLVPVETGKLRDSIRVSSVKLDSTHSSATASVKAGKPGKNKKDSVFYAHMVEFGTLPHLIEADGSGRRAGNLNHAAKRNALVIGPGLFVEAVHHPGAKAEPFMRPAADNAHEQAVDAAAAYLKDALDKLI